MTINDIVNPGDVLHDQMFPGSRNWYLTVLSVVPDPRVPGDELALLHVPQSGSEPYRWRSVFDIHRDMQPRESSTIDGLTHPPRLTKDLPPALPSGD